MMLFGRKFVVPLVIVLTTCTVVANPMKINVNKHNKLKPVKFTIILDSPIKMFDLLFNNKEKSDSTKKFKTIKKIEKDKKIENVSQVDNSETKYFPDIKHQEDLNNCTVWAGVYYQMSYMVNKKLDRDGKLEENIFSPIWVYNMINEGENAGTDYVDVLAVLKEVGAVSIANVPIEIVDNGYNIRNLHARKEMFMQASKYKISDFYDIDLKNVDNDTAITSNKDKNLEKIKNALIKGEILSATTYADIWNRAWLQENKTNEVNNDYIGEAIVTRCDGDYEGTHRITVVGFNDNIWVDINENGIVEEGEKGAFKIANSWGTEEDNKGFIWIAYDALNKVSSVPDSENITLTSEKREVGLFDVVGIKVDVNDKDNDVFLNIDMATNNAREVAVNIIAKDKATGKKVGDYNPIPFLYASTILKIGQNAFDGTDDANAEGNFYIDLSNVVKGISKDNLKKYDFEITINDSFDDESTLKVNNARFYIKSADKYIKTAVNETVEFNFKSLIINYGSVNDMSLSEVRFPEEVE